MIHVICVAYERPIPLQILIGSFIVQTNPNWVLHVVHDGKAPKEIIDVVTPFKEKDNRVHFYESAERYENYGHPNRKTMLQTIETNLGDFILMQNDDNYVVPRIIEFILKEASGNVGIIYWDTVHSHDDYNVHHSELYENGIDMAAFVVRADVAKQTGFNHIHFSADGRYAEECAATCKRKGLKFVKIKKPLLVHN